MRSTENIHILDTTLRDGSYAVNFTFSLADVRLICSLLERVGISFIEIGHGVGLRASGLEHGTALHSDEEYLEAAKGVAKQAKIGMFCIPGVAKLQDIDAMADRGMDFIRIGTSVTEVALSEPYIKKAKERGMVVMANYMKSYASTPKEFAQQVVLSEKFGADVVYVVDSSGGMFAQQIEAYTNEIRAVSSIELGFHGHNNLGLAVSNTLKAAELGYKFLDTSLQGLGRSSGNAPTEQTIAAMIKLGYELDINLLDIIAFGYEYVNHFVENKGLTPLDTISGYADFHTSYLQKIQRYAAKYSVNPLELIMDVCKIDKVNAPDELVEKVASQLQVAEQQHYRYPYYKYHGKEQH